MDVLRSVGLIGMGGYVPAKKVPNDKCKQLVKFLRKETLLYPEYIDEIEESGHLPGTIETNYDGWESKPWYKSWLEHFPPKKKEKIDAISEEIEKEKDEVRKKKLEEEKLKLIFQKREERRRVPMDPVSMRESIQPHPMLSSDAETLAGALAIFNTGIDKDEIDLVLVHSLVPDFHVPMNASLVQHKLGIKNTAAFNIDTCCSSFVSMLEIAMTYVRCGLKKNVLVIGSSLDSIIMDKTTYYSVVPGDTAVAGIVSEVEDSYGYISSYARSEGDRHKAIIFKHRSPELLLTTSQGSHYEQEFVTFHDHTALKEIAKHAPEDMAIVVKKALQMAGLSAADIDFVVMHQPSHWATKAWCDVLGVPMDKNYETYEKYGNLAVASVAVNLLEAIELGKIKEGDRVMTASSGVGSNHIAVFQRISPLLIKNNRL